MTEISIPTKKEYETFTKRERDKMDNELSDRLEQLSEFQKKKIINNVRCKL